MSLAEQVRLAGVVGAGGGGFPTHLKLAGRADTVIANGAECEPLLHKDAAVLEDRAADVIDGLRAAMEAVGARRGVVAIKAKNTAAVEAVRDRCGAGIELHLLNDYYPAGDEYELVHEIAHRVIPPGGIPIQVGCVVQNVETLANIADAARGMPVTVKTLTVAGAVREPCTISVPIGTPLRACLEAAGGALVSAPYLVLGGLMMGRGSTDLDQPVTKTLAGIIVLPATHPVALRQVLPPRAQERIGRSACDQCRYCTEYCPRYLLGYPVEPHRVMRGLGFQESGVPRWSEWAAYCCSCGLCTLFACPEALFPREACDDARLELRRSGWKPASVPPVRLHPMRHGRHVPVRALLRRLAVEAYDLPAPHRKGVLEVPVLSLKLAQHAGQPAVPAVAVGDRVAAAAVVGEPPAGVVGARVHAPRAGRVKAVTSREVVLEVAA